MSPRNNLKLSQMTQKKEVSKPKVWDANYYITGFGHVKHGDKVSNKALEAWNRTAPKGSSPKVSNE